MSLLGNILIDDKKVKRNKHICKSNEFPIVPNKEAWARILTVTEAEEENRRQMKVLRPTGWPPQRLQSQNKEEVLTPGSSYVLVYQCNLAISKWSDVFNPIVWYRWEVTASTKNFDGFTAKNTFVLRINWNILSWISFKETVVDMKHSFIVFF